MGVRIQFIKRVPFLFMYEVLNRIIGDSQKLKNENLWGKIHLEVILLHVSQASDCNP